MSRDKVSGLDVALNYRFSAGEAGDFTLHGNATYLKSRRVLIAGQSDFDLAGTIFNPAHLKARGGLARTQGPLQANMLINYIGGVTDNRRVTLAKLHGMTTVDLSFKYHLGSAEHGLDVQLSGLNIFNAKPDVVNNTSNIFSFDSTNYSSFGRYLSVSLTKAL